MLTGVTQEGSRRVAMVVHVQGSEGAVLVNPRCCAVSTSLRPDGERVCAKTGDPMLPRKASTRGPSRPYPKPTQVVR